MTRPGLDIAEHSLRDVGVPNLPNLYRRPPKKRKKRKHISVKVRNSLGVSEIRSKRHWHLTLGKDNRKREGVLDLPSSTCHLLWEGERVLKEAGTHFWRTNQKNDWPSETQDPRPHRIQIVMIRPIRVDNTKFLKAAIKIHSFTPVPPPHTRTTHSIMEIGHPTHQASLDTYPWISPLLYFLPP